MPKFPLKFRKNLYLYIITNSLICSRLWIFCEKVSNHSQSFPFDRFIIGNLMTSRNFPDCFVGENWEMVLGFVSFGTSVEIGPRFSWNYAPLQNCLFDFFSQLAHFCFFHSLEYSPFVLAPLIFVTHCKSSRETNSSRHVWMELFPGYLMWGPRGMGV